MGEVYRARDTRLNRDVALKLLPASVASDPERLARFTREAQLLAALNHPNIAAIHGLEESGGQPALVLELVAGETLASRLARGAVPVDEAVGIMRQIAEGLEFAHEQGIVHRDLKPANVMLRPDGTVKLLDFGLAKALGASDPGSSRAAAAMHSPTMVTSPATAPGIILGTAAYMAPEQARGAPTDRRVDIWPFGVVFYELLAGTRPFGGETISDTMAAILRDEPAWKALPDETPAQLQRLVRRALMKDPRRRLRDVGDARLLLEDIQGGADLPESAAVERARPAFWVSALPWALAGAALGAAVIAVTRPRATVTAPELPTLRYTLSLPNLQFERTLLPTMSPDGRHVVFSNGGQLWVRDLDKLEARAVTTVAGAQFPFWSPDSRQVAYLTANALWRVGIDGSPPVRIASYRFSKGGRTPGGVWRRDGTIVFAPASTGSGLMVVSAAGGEFRDLIAIDEAAERDFHRPSLLPDGSSMLYVVDRVDSGADTIGVLSGTTRKAVLQLKGEYLDSPVYSPSGHILYHRETTTPGVWAVPFSLERLEVSGAPFLVAPQGSWPTIGANGVLVYADSELSGLEELVWLDVTSGSVTPALDARFPSIWFPRLSPDGTRVAAAIRASETGTSIVVADLQRHTHVQIADRATTFSRPSWRDNQSIVYALDAGRGEVLASRRADASQPQVELFEGTQPSVDTAGRLFFVRLERSLRGGLWRASLPATGGVPGEPTIVQQTPAHEWEPTLSPDGTLLAYSSGDAGQSVVMLRGYPETPGQWQVSAGGGSLPQWSPAGDKLYFRELSGNIMVVDVKAKPEVSLSAPRLVPKPATLIARAGFDVARDGKRLLLPRPVSDDHGRGPALTVVQNWFAEFRKERDEK
jgi:Tol biopolymer transport system component